MQKARRYIIPFSVHNNAHPFSPTLSHATANLLTKDQQIKDEFHQVTGEKK